MKRLLIGALLSLASLSIVLFPEEVQASYEKAWDFVCEWDCGIAHFEPEYGGYTVHGYSSSFYSMLPVSEAEAANWAYYDYWLPAGCSGFSTVFSQTVCLDTAFFHGVGAWHEFSRLYWDYSDDELACKVISERAAARDPNSPFAEGWKNRDNALASLGYCQ
jgi:hypothetical protein